MKWWNKIEPHLLRVLVGSGLLVYVLNLVAGTSTLFAYIVYTLLSYMIGIIFIKGKDEHSDS